MPVPAVSNVENPFAWSRAVSDVSKLYMSPVEIYIRTINLCIETVDCRLSTVDAKEFDSNPRLKNAVRIF